MTVVDELIGRSNRLGSDPRNTNYAGGNTSAKGTAVDPVTGEDTDLLWVKGSGGDLGTLRPAGLAVLRLDRLRSLVDVYPGVDREDEMVAAFDYCLWGKGGAAPSIDTAMHGLVDAEALAAAQQAGDVLGANAVLMDAYSTDVRPLLAAVREEAGLEPDPVAAYLRSGYAEKIVAERTGGQQAGWGA